jgi:hypothetical protein
LRLSHFVGRAGLAAAAATSALVVQGLTQALQLVDQCIALRAYPVAITLVAPSLRGSIEARVIVDITHG